MRDPFADWYDRTVTVTKPGGTDEWGAHLPGVDINVPCRISEQIQLVRDQSGEQVTSTTTIHAAIAHAADFAPDSPVAYDTPAGPRTSQVISVSVATGDPDLEGITVRLQ